MDRIMKSKMTYLLFLSVLITLYSCSEFYDDFFENKIENARVETLISNFQADDGLSVDRFGNIYASRFASFSGTTLVRVDPDTAEVTVAVDSLVNPTGNVVDEAGAIFVVNNVRRRSADSNEIFGDVLKIASDGTRIVVATLPGFPSGITLDRQGNIYVSNFSFPGVHKITPEGEVSVYVQDARLLGGVGIDFDFKGNLFVGNFNTGDILQIHPDRSVEVLATIPTVVENFVIGYITYFAGSIFATAPGEGVIYRVSMSGEASVFAGNGVKTTQDGPLEEASFNVPNGITADPKRKVLYVTEGGDSVSLRVIRLR